jgi:N4-gp56 family major capsid protein
MGTATQSTTTTLTNTIKAFYDRLLLDVLEPSLRFYQFAEKKPLPTGEGTTVIWNRPTALSVGQKLTEGTAPSANALSTQKVSAKIEQLGGYIVATDLVQLTSITDVMKLATERLAQQAANTIDRYIMEAIVMNNDLTVANGGSAINIVKTSGNRLDISASKALIPSAGGTPTGQDKIAVSDVRAAVFKLRSLNALTVDGQNYIGIIHPNVSEDLQADTTWQSYHQYTTPEFLYRGEIGRVHGCRFVETTNAPVTRGSSNGLAVSEATAGQEGTSALGYGTVIFGKGFYGCTELDGGVKTFMVTGPTKSDPLSQADTYGWKASVAARILNTSAGLILWTGSEDDLTGVSSTSAAVNGGVNVGANLWDDTSGMESLIVTST